MSRMPDNTERTHDCVQLIPSGASEQHTGWILSAEPDRWTAGATLCSVQLVCFDYVLRQKSGGSIDLQFTMSSSFRRASSDRVVPRTWRDAAAVSLDTASRGAARRYYDSWNGPVRRTDGWST